MASVATAKRTHHVIMGPVLLAPARISPDRRVAQDAPIPVRERTMMAMATPIGLAVVLISLALPGLAQDKVQVFDLPAGARPHDVAPAPHGGVWYTAQRQGALGILDPATGDVVQIPLGDGSAPHGVIAGPDGAAWITDSGLNAIVRVDPASREVTRYPLPEDTGYANLNTAAFDGDGVLWFTGQNGIYGRLDPADGAMEVFDAPEGRGPYGITATPDGAIYYASLAGSHIARVDTETGDGDACIEPPTPGQGARRVWSDSKATSGSASGTRGQVSRYDPATGDWRTWKLPGDAARRPTRSTSTTRTSCGSATSARTR